MARVVVGLDGSAGSGRALAWAARAAELRGAVLEVVHVQRPPEHLDPYSLLDEPIVRPPEAREAAETMLREAVDRADLPPDLHVDLVVVEGHVPRVLVERAVGADLLVVGARGRGGFAGLLLGSRASSASTTPAPRSSSFPPGTDVPPAAPCYRAAMVEQMPDTPAAARAMHGIVLALARERALEPVLERLVEAARDLVGARYAAIGVPDGLGGFAKFIYTGMTAEQVAAIGPLPRVHGLLAAMLQQTASYRTDDITRDPRFRYWPPAHPDMRSFLGVPVISQGEVIAAIYCTDKASGAAFTAADQDCIELLAAHAAVAIDNARLWERSRELTLAEERAATARDLHDAMSQRLFSLALTVDVARRALPEDPSAAAGHLDTVRELVAGVQRELRALITDLRPADLAGDGLGAALRQQTRLLDRATGLRMQGEIRDVALDSLRARELLLLAQEALHNALRHAAAGSVRVDLAEDGDAVRLVIADDGVGFDPEDERIRARHLGLASMRERARTAGGVVRIESAPGRGTTVTAEVPSG